MIRIGIAQKSQKFLRDDGLFVFDSWIIICTNIIDIVHGHRGDKGSGALFLLVFGLADRMEAV